MQGGSFALNPDAKEFVPSSYSGEQTSGEIVRKSNNSRRRPNWRFSRPQREDSIRRTVHIADVDKNVSEEELASVFTARGGHVIDCRICEDPHLHVDFAFVVFSDERGATDALQLHGTVVGSYAIKVLPSRTAISHVNPTYLPKSEHERELVAKTIYCINIDMMFSSDDVRRFFETNCGKVTRMRLLNDNQHSPRTAFVEFATVESATAALNCDRMLLGNLPIRVSPSKTPVKVRSRGSGRSQE